METKDYPGYLKTQSDGDLLSIKSSLDRHMYPDRYDLIEEEIQLRKKVPWRPITKPQLPTLTPEEIAKKESAKEGWLLLLRGLVGLWSLSYLFGQYFCGTFGMEMTVTGICGCMVAIFGGWRSRSVLREVIVILCVIAALTGIGIQAYVYYASYHYPGNCFGWHLIVPYAIGMVILAKSWPPAKVRSDKSGLLHDLYP